MQVFHIDDDEDDRYLFAEALRQIDSTILYSSAKTCQQALHILCETPGPKPDIIFLDLNMPCISGMDCLKQLRAINSFKLLPVIIYTTSRSFQEMNRARQLGATDFLIKQTSFATIKEVLAAVLRKYVPVYNLTPPAAKHNQP